MHRQETIDTAVLSELDLYANCCTNYYLTILNFYIISVLIFNNL